LNPLIEYCPNGQNLKLGENKMKTRIITGIMIVALVALSVGVAAAQYGHGDGGGAQYVDANADNVCDNIGTYPGFVDADNDGVCDNNCGRGRGGCGCGGMEFVDEDDDSVCDNIGINGRDSDSDGIPNGQEDDYKPPRDGSGHGNGGHGKGHNR
jgi:hypothetical protein